LFQAYSSVHYHLQMFLWAVSYLFVGFNILSIFCRGPSTMLLQIGA
jgi:hypothetical protein